MIFVIVVPTDKLAAAVQKNLIPAVLRNLANKNVIEEKPELKKSS